MNNRVTPLSLNTLCHSEQTWTHTVNTHQCLRYSLDKHHHRQLSLSRDKTIVFWNIQINDLGQSASTEEDTESSRRVQVHSHIRIDQVFPYVLRKKNIAAHFECRCWKVYISSE